MKDLTIHVQPAGGLQLFPDTCRISGNDPNPGDKSGCQGNTARPCDGHDPKTKPDPCNDSRPGSDHDRGPRRASDLDTLRLALRAGLSG